MKITVLEVSTGDNVTDQCMVMVGVRSVADVFSVVVTGPHVPDSGWAFARVRSTRWRDLDWIHRDVLDRSDGIVMVEKRRGI